MNTNVVQTSYAKLFKATLEGVDPDLHPDTYQRTTTGAHLRVPLSESAIIGVEGVGGRESLPAPVRFLGGAEDSPILARLRFIETDQSKAKWPYGASLPAAHWTSPTGAPAASASPVIGDVDVELDKVLEGATISTVQAIIQSADCQVDEIIQVAHGQAMRAELLRALIAGSGLGNIPLGVSLQPGTGAAVYAEVERGIDEPFTLAENTIVDAGGMPGRMAWSMGVDVHTSAQGLVIEPGASRRVLERDRLTLGGTVVERIGPVYPALLAVCADWSSVIVPMLDEVLIVLDRITVPGYVKITSRLALASPVISVPGAVYRLQQA